MNGVSFTYRNTFGAKMIFRIALCAICAGLIAGCDGRNPRPSVPYLTNDQIIAETKKCEGAGLSAVAVSQHGWPTQSSPQRIMCQPNGQMQRIEVRQ